MPVSRTTAPDCGGEWMRRSQRDSRNEGAEGISRFAGARRPDQRLEREITKLLELVSDIAARIGVEPLNREEIEEMKREVAPEAVLDAIQQDG
jgi:hypothetical protein